MTSLNKDPIDREFAEAWIPDPGDTLRKFEVVHTSERQDSFNEDRMIPIVTGIVGEGSTEKGEPLEPGSERAVHGIHASLRYKFADLKVAPGDVIAAKFLGWHRKGEPADGLGPGEVPQGAKASDGSFRYRLIRYRDEKRGIDWSRYRDDDEESAAALAPAKELAEAMDDAPDELPF
jgi:hypothetical protein